MGGANKVSFILKRNFSNSTHVSLVSISDSEAADCTVRNTLWQKTACLFTKSTPEKYEFMDEVVDQRKRSPHEGVAICKKSFNTRT